jgi:PAS domain S-box-containing protein
MPILFWLDVTALGLSTVIAGALVLLALGAGVRRPPNLFFALFAFLEALWALFSLLLRLSLWLERGNAPLLLEAASLSFALMAPMLLLFTVRYVGRLSRWADLTAGVGLAAIAALAIPLFRHQLLFDPRLHASGGTYSEVSSWGILAAVVPALFLVGSLVLFWQERHRAGETYLPLGVLVLLLGLVVGGVLAVTFPVLSVTNVMGMSILGYAVVSRQILNPLREQTAQLRILSSAVEQSANAIAIIDHDGVVVYANSSFLEWNDFRPEEVIGQNWRSFLSADATLREKYAEIRDTVLIQVKAWQAEVRDRTRGGEEIWREATLFPIKDDSGNLIRTVYLSEDITERKRAEDALRQSEERLSSFLDSATDSFFLLDEDMCFLEINQRGLEIIGRPKEDVIGEHITEVVPDVVESGRYERHLEVLRTGTPFTIDRFVPHPAFGDRHFVLKSFKVGDGLGVIASDVTERVQAREALRRYAGRLEVLRSIDQGILGAQLPKDIAQAALSRIRQLIPCERVEVVLPGPGFAEMVVLAVDTDVDTAIKEGHRFTRDQLDDVRAIVQQGQTAVIDDLPSRGSALQQLYKEGLHTYVVVPLLSQGDLIGTLSFGLAEGGGFDQEATAIARQVADQLAIAIQQSHLHEEIQRHAEELERRVVERTRELEEERDFSSAVMDTAGALVLVLDREGRIVRFNRACEQLTGYSLDEVAGRYVWDLFLIPAEVAAVQAIFEELRGGHFPIEHENYWMAQDGSQRLIAWSNTCLLDAEGSVEYVIATGIDVEEERKRQREASTLAELARLVSGTLDLEQVFDQVVEYAQQVLDVDHCSLDLYNQDRKSIRFAAGANIPPDILTDLRRLEYQIDSGIHETVLELQHAVVIEDAYRNPQIPPPLRPFVQQLEMQSILVAPMEAGGETLGFLVLSLERGRQRQFSAEDADLALVIASQAAMAMENARYYEAEQRRAEQFRVISEVGRRITSILAVDDLLQEIVRLVRDSLGYYLVGIALNEGGELVFKAGAGAAWDDHLHFEPLRLKVGQNGLTGWVAQTGEPLLIPDVRREPRYYPHALTPEVRSELVVPLATKEGIIGVLHAQSTNLNAFDESDLNVLQSLAHQAAVAIENAQLYEQAQQAAVLEERQRLARDLHDSVTQALYSVTLIAETGKRAAQADQSEQVSSYLDRLGEVAQQALKEMRLLIYELRPPALEQAGLVGALQQRLDTVEGRAGIEHRLLVDGALELPSSIEEALYRVAQEALNNALKHAAASVITVRISVHDKQVELEVTDNGRGFDPATDSDAGGLGLLTIRERVEKIEGVLTIESTPEKGTSIRVKVTVPNRSDAQCADQKPGGG